MMLRTCVKRNAVSPQRSSRARAAAALACRSRTHAYRMTTMMVVVTTRLNQGRM
jgi:hypothetical protein